MSESNSQVLSSGQVTVTVNYVWLKEQHDFKCNYDSIFGNDTVCVSDLITYLVQQFPKFEKKMPTNTRGKPVDFMFSYFDENKQHYVYLGNFHLLQTTETGKSANFAVIQRQDLLCQGNSIILKFRVRAGEEVLVNKGKKEPQSTLKNAVLKVHNWRKLQN